MPDSYSNVVTEIKISELPAATAANASDQIEANQAGTTRRITVDQVATLVADVIDNANLESVVDVRSFGALGNDSNDDYPAIQAAVNYVKTHRGYGSILIPPGTYQLKTGEIILDADNLHLVISLGATLKQMTYGWSTVQVRNCNGCSVGGGGQVVNTFVPKVLPTGSWADGSARERWTGVYCYETNDTTVYDLTFKDMYLCVYFRPSIANVMLRRGENNSWRDCITYRHDFGLLATGQRNLTVRNIRGYTTTLATPTVSAPPPHLIYMSWYNAPGELVHENITFSDIVDYDNPWSSSIKVKHTDGISITNFISRKCARGMDLNCDHLTLVSPQVYESVDIGDSQQAGLVFEECNFVEVSNPIVIIPDGNTVVECIVVRDTCSDITIRGGLLSANYTIAQSGHARLYGPRAKLIDTIFEQRGISNPVISFHSTAVDCALIRPHVKNATGTRIANVDAGALNSRIIINQDLCNFDYVIPTSVSELGTGTRISFEGRMPRATSAILTTALAPTYQTQVVVTNSVAGKNPARSDNRVWYYPDGSTLVANGEALGWQAALVAAGGTVSAPRLAVIQTFIDAEKASGAWYQTDDYWCLWGENATQGLFSLKQRRFLTIGGGAPVFTADRGYAFDGVADWINTNFAPATHGVAMTGINLRLAWYERVNVGTTTYVAGVYEGSLRNLRSRPRTSGNINQSDVNCAATTFASGILDSRGYTAISRNDTIYVTNKNGVASAPVVPGSNATVLPSTNIYLGGLNNAGVAGSFRATSLGLACVGASLTAAQETAQYNAVQAWATSIGANV